MYVLSRNSGRSLIMQPFFSTNVIMMIGELIIAHMIIQGVEEIHFHNLRIFMAVTSLAVWWKNLYFLNLHPSFAPLIRTIWQCMYEIRHFIIVISIVMVAHAQAFYFLARNQN